MDKRDNIRKVVEGNILTHSNDSFCLLKITFTYSDFFIGFV